MSKRHYHSTVAEELAATEPAAEESPAVESAAPTFKVGDRVLHGKCKCRIESVSEDGAVCGVVTEDAKRAYNVPAAELTKQ